MTNRTTAILTGILAAWVAVPAGRADVPRTLNYQGKLRTADGAAAEGPVDLTVALYGHATDSAPVLFGPELHQDVVLTRGLFSIQIGSQSGGVPDSALDAASVYLGVSVNAGPDLSPRVEIVAEPFSLKTKSAEQLVEPDTFSPAVTVATGGDVGIGVALPQARVHVEVDEATTPPLRIDSYSDGLILPLTGWEYRQEITIDNAANGSALADYQVLLAIDTASLVTGGKLEADGDDIRITDSDGTTLLAYWIESGMNTGNTRIWTKVPSIPANGQKTLYFYYGNPSATALSNATSVFDLYDDFNRPDNNTVGNGWVESRNGQPIGTEGSPSDNRISGNTMTANFGAVIQHAFNPAVPYLIEFEIFSNAWGDVPRLRVKSLSSGTAATTNGYGIDFANGPTINLVDHNGSQKASVGFSYSNGTWYSVKFSFDPSSNVTNVKMWVRGQSEPGSWNVTWAGGALVASGTDVLFSHGQGTTGYSVDVVRARKYTSPEPTTSLGEEQTASTPGMATRLFIEPNTGYVGVGTITPQGALDVNGPIFQRGGQIHADYVFDRSRPIEPIAEHAARMWQRGHLPAIGPRKVDAGGREFIEIGSDRRGIVEELEKAHIYIHQLHEDLATQQAEIERLREDVRRLIQSTRCRTQHDGATSRHVQNDENR